MRLHRLSARCDNVSRKFAGYLDLKGEKNRPNKHDALRAFACLADYMYLSDENTSVNGTVTIFDAGNYTMKLQRYVSLEERRDFIQTWQVRTHVLIALPRCMTTKTTITMNANRQEIAKKKNN